MTTKKTTTSPGQSDLLGDPRDPAKLAEEPGKTLAPPKKPTRSEKLIRSSILIEDEAPRGGSVGYMHAVLSQIGLPRKKVQERSFTRKNGGAVLLIEAGSIWDGRNLIEQPLPYGPKPRVMMADLFTYAIKHKTRVIDLGNSVSEYLRRLGYTNQGGAKGPLTMFRRQAQALAACHMTLGVNYGGQAHTLTGKPIKKFSAWLDTQGQQKTMWPATLELSLDFWESLQEFAVPLDMRAIHSLSGSALALDLYTALAHRLHRLNKPLYLHWASIKEQFGQEYRTSKDFKKKFVLQLRAVLVAYPGAKVREVKGGLMLYPSPPPVKKNRVVIHINSG